MTDDQKQPLIDRLSRNIKDEGAWSELFKLLAYDGAVTEVLSLLARRHELRRDAAKFALEAVDFLILKSEWPTLRKLYQETPKESAFHGFFAYGAAIGNAQTFDLDATVRMLREATFSSVSAFQQFFSHESKELLKEVLQQTNLIERSDFARAQPAPLGIEWPEIAPGGPLIVASCDETYFTAYAERFIRSLSAAMPSARFLIHVINPTGDGVALRAGLLREFPSGAFSHETGPRDTAFYASRRFMICPEICRRYGSDVIVMDIDSTFPGYFERMVARSREAQVAYIAPRKHFLPTLLVSGAYIYLRANAPAAAAFARHCAAYLSRKFEMGDGMWFIDQAALYRAVCLCGSEAGLLDLAEKEPHILDGLIGGHVVSNEERMAWSSRNRPITGIHFDADLRPSFQYADPVQ